VFATGDVWSSLLSGLVPALAVLVGTAVVSILVKRRNAAKEGAEDMSTLTTFFFDKPGNPRTHTPGTKGWTTKVDEALVLHGNQLGQILTKLDTVVAEVTPDGNGGHNLHGQITRAAGASAKAAAKAEEAAEHAAAAATLAEAEAEAQHDERDRVQAREQAIDERP
jgi:hypothetical protein